LWGKNVRRLAHFRCHSRTFLAAVIVFLQAWGGHRLTSTPLTPRRVLAWFWSTGDAAEQAVDDFRGVSAPLGRNDAAKVLDLACAWRQTRGRRCGRAEDGTVNRRHQVDQLGREGEGLDDNGLLGEPNGLHRGGRGDDQLGAVRLRNDRVPEYDEVVHLPVRKNPLQRLADGHGRLARRSWDRPSWQYIIT
jgi:hypothetical protein